MMTQLTPYLEMCRGLVDAIIAARGCTVREAVEELGHLLAGAPRSVQAGVIQELRAATGGRHLVAVR